MVALVSPEVPGGEVVVQLIFTPNIWITIVTVTGNFTVTGKVTTINISNLNAQCSMFLCMSECWHILEGFSRTCSSHHTPTIIIPDPLAGDSSRQQHQYQITLVVLCWYSSSEIFLFYLKQCLLLLLLVCTIPRLQNFSWSRRGNYFILKHKLLSKMNILMWFLTKNAGILHQRHSDIDLIWLGLLPNILIEVLVG